jgi:hypothetical protein
LYKPAELISAICEGGGAAEAIQEELNGAFKHLQDTQQ